MIIRPRVRERRCCRKYQPIIYLIFQIVLTYEVLYVLSFFTPSTKLALAGLGVILLSAIYIFLKKTKYIYKTRCSNFMQ